MSGIAGDFDYDILLRDHVKFHGDIKVPPSSYIDIESSGTVGIGTTSPDTILSVTTSTIPDNEYLYVYKTSESLTNKTTQRTVQSSPSQTTFQERRLERLKRVILDMECIRE